MSLGGCGGHDRVRCPTGDSPTAPCLPMPEDLTIRGSRMDTVGARAREGRQGEAGLGEAA